MFNYITKKSTSSNFTGNKGKLMLIYRWFYVYYFCLFNILLVELVDVGEAFYLP